MGSQPIKAVSKEFTDEPFHLIQSNGSSKRYVVSLKDKVRIRTLLAGFINQSKDEIEIKIRDVENPDNQFDFSFSYHTKS